MHLPLACGHADLDRRTVASDGRAVKLSPNEARLLRYLSERPGQTVTHAELRREVFGYADSVKSRTVISTMQRLRRKIERDPAEPEHLQNVYGRGYRFEPLGEASGLLGRTAEMNALRHRLESGRLWLVAPGGYGKTALVRQYARLHSARTVWIDLTDIATVEELLSATAQALGIGPVDQPAALREALRHHAPSLLVLDAAESLGDAALPFVVEWSEIVATLITSRRPVTDEPTFQLGPLPPGAAERLLTRAAPTPVDETTLRRLIDGLEGVPLALELAGARLALFNPADLAAQLDDLANVLSGGAGRQGSMDEVLAWTWAQLPEPLRRALGLLAPARQGLRVADALSLLGSGGLDHLGQLQRWGLLHRREDRVAMLDPVRQFVERRSGREAAEAAHRRLFLDRARERADDLQAGRGRHMLDEEWGNLRTALQTGWRARAAESVELALLLVPSMGQRIPMAEALRWLDEAASFAEGPLLGDVLVMRAGLWMSRSSLDAAEADLRQAEAVGVRDAGILALNWGRWHQDRQEFEASQQSLERAIRQLRGTWGMKAELALAYTQVKAGDEDGALARLRRVLARARVQSAPLPILVALGTLGVLHTRRDAFDAARDDHLEALAICEEERLDLAAARVHTQLGAVELYRGDREAAALHWRHALAISRRLGAQVGVAMAQANLANLDLVARRFEDAEERLDAARRIFAEAGFGAGVAYAQLGQGRQASLQRRWQAAEQLFDTCEASLSPQLRWLAGAERCVARALRGNAQGARRALDAMAPPTDAGSRAGRRLAEAFCTVAEGKDGRRAAQRAILDARAVRDPVVQDLAERLKAWVRPGESGRD